MPPLSIADRLATLLAAPSKESHSIELRPHWIYRWLSRRKHDAAILRGDRLELRIGAHDLNLLCTDTRVTVRRRLLFADLLVTSPTGTATLGGVPLTKAIRFERLVRLRASNVALNQVIAERHELFTGTGYLNQNRLQHWIARAEEAIGPLVDVSTDSPPPALAQQAAALHSLRITLRDAEAQVTARNDAFVADEKKRFAQHFNTLERYPLSERQVDAILHDEDHALVVAGAGTGKTSTIIGKIAYLQKSGTVENNEILALAFNRKAAEEMTTRVQTSLGGSVVVRTFHALGLQVVAAVNGERPSISELASDPAALSRWIGDQLDEILRNPELRHLYLNFAVRERDRPREKKEFRSKEELKQYYREQEPRTLTGVRVRSFEERLLADWMTLNGIRYEYERPYEHYMATAGKRQYKPDFYLPDYAVYVEHFGVDRSGATAAYVDKAKYNNEMQWKRRTHQQYGTRLIETYSYERMEGTHCGEWRTKFESAGILLRELTYAEIDEVVGKAVRSELAGLLTRFLVIARENIQDLDELRDASSGRNDVRRCTTFLALFEEIHRRYEAHLRSRREIDFADMVANAASYIENGRYTPGYRRIIVDEFQDISRGRLRLLQAILRATPDARMLCVGDDWQSINGFAGSDVGAMVRFNETFGYTRRTDLDQTFRFNDRLSTATSHFVQQNPFQLRKNLKAPTKRATPAITVLYDANGGLDTALDAIKSDESFGGRASVLVLGRYNATRPRDFELVAMRHQSLKVSFLTVHQSKGLEADYVIILDVAAKRLGFPSRVESDPLLTLVLPADNEIRFAEERRLFYVALTRARHRVFVCAPSKAPSVFASELELPEYDGLVSVAHGH